MTFYHVGLFIIRNESGTVGHCIRICYKLESYATLELGERYAKVFANRSKIAASYMLIATFVLRVAVFIIVTALYINVCFMNHGNWLIITMSIIWFILMILCIRIITAVGITAYFCIFIICTYLKLRYQEINDNIDNLLKKCMWLILKF